MKWHNCSCVKERSIIPAFGSMFVAERLKTVAESTVQFV